MTESNTPSTRNASASAGHDGASPIATTASAAATPATAPTRPLPKRAISTPANPPARSPPIGSAAIAAPSSALVRPSPSRISGSRGRYDETSMPLAKNSVLTAMRADRARAALTEGIIGRLWCPSSRGARGEPALSSRRCLSFPRSRPSPATSGAASCRPTAGPARRSRARASSWLRTLRDEDPARFVGGRDGSPGRGDRAARQAADRRPLRRRVPDGPPQDDGPAVRGAGVAAAGPVRAARAVARRRTRAALPRHPQVRPGRAVRRRRRPVRRRRPRAPGPAVHAARVPPAHPGPPRAPQAAPGRPGVHRRGGQHLRRRGPVAVEAAPAAHGAHPAPGRRAAALPGRRRGARRGRRASRLLDRRLHGARRRRRDAGAPRRLPAHRPAVPPLRAPDPADRDRHPRHPLLLVVPAAAGRAIARARRRSCAR